MKVSEETRKARRKQTNEVFTPPEIVKIMCDKIDDSDWADPKKTVLEPCFGNGNFLVEIIRRRIALGVDWQTTLETLYGVELMPDNVIEAKERILKLLGELGVAYNEETAKEILDRQLVCSDFFKWDFEHWCPLPEPEHKSKRARKK